MVRLGIIGLGNMGRNHLRVASVLPHALLIGGHDANPKIGGRLCQEYGCKFFKNPEKLIAACDALILALPTKLHFIYAKKCLQQGKHVFIEKPLATHVREAAKLKPFLRGRSHLVVQVGHVERFSPVYSELKKILATEKILACTAMRLSPFSKQAADVSVTYDLLIHDIDIMLSLFRLGPKDIAKLKISAMGRAVGSPHLNYVDAQMRLPGDIIVNMLASKITQEKVRQYHITCKNSYILADFLTKTVNIFRHQVSDYIGVQANIKYQQASLVERVHVPNIEPLQAEMLHFIECIRTRRKPTVGFNEGLTALQIADKIERLSTRPG